MSSKALTRCLMVSSGYWMLTVGLTALGLLELPSWIGTAYAEEGCGILLSNGCFESGDLTGWKGLHVTISANKTKLGHYAAQLGSGKNPGGFVQQTVQPLSPRTSYVAETWIATSQGLAKVFFKVTGKGIKTKLKKLTANENWQSIQIQFTTGAKPVSAKLVCQVKSFRDKGSVAYCDEFSLLTNGQSQPNSTPSPQTVPNLQLDDPGGPPLDPSVVSPSPKPVSLPSPVPSVQPNPTIMPTPAPPSASAQRGETLWQVNTCGNCHGTPALLSNQVTATGKTLRGALIDSIANNKGGMAQFGSLSDLDRLDLEAYVNDSSHGTSEDPSGTAIVGVSRLNNAATLRKAAIQLAGRLPSNAEMARVDTDQGLRQVLRELMQGPRFIEFLRDTARRHFLTAGSDLDDGDLQADIPAMKNLIDTGKYDEYYQNKSQLQEEPVELVRYIAENDHPYTEALTAAYSVVTPGLAEILGTTLLQPFQTGAADEWAPATVNSISARTPELQANPFQHAGVLSTRAWLTRFPTTDTNRNRHRAKMLMRQFLGYDIETLGQRPVDDSQNGSYLVPTMENANCVICHQKIEPIAGSFMNWGIKGQFWDNQGEDSLSDSYRSDAYYLDATGASWYTKGDKWYRDMFEPGYQGKNMPGGRFGFNQPDPSTALVPETAWTVVDATPNQDTRSGDKAIDGNPSTIWRTQTSPVYQSFPHHLTVDMGAEINLTGTRYLPRQDGASGSHVKEYELRLSLDGVVWQTVATGAFASYDTSPKDVTFAETRARYFNWVINSSFGTSATPNSATAEISMLRKPDESSIPNKKNVNGGQNSLQWLSQEIIKDPGFAKGSVLFWYRGLFGRNPLVPVINQETPDFARQLAAYQTQENVLNPVAEQFALGGYKVRDLLVDLILTDYFRADSAVDKLTDAQTAALAEMGVGRLLSADSLNAKAIATIGNPIFGDPYQDVGLLYNGFDGGADFVRGNASITPLMLSAAESSIHAALCDNRVVSNDFAQVTEKRSLFKFVIGNESPESFTADPPSATAHIEVARWNGINGSSVANLETSSKYALPPDQVTYLDALDTVPNSGDYYGERLRGYLLAPTDGDYTFWVSGDDQVSLRLIVTPESGSLTEIAKVTGYTARYTYDAYPEQQSTLISLKGGQMYLLEVIHKEGGGGDHVTVAWSGPGFSRRTLGGSDLVPIHDVSQAEKATYLLPIKRNIQYLHGRLLGEDLSIDDPEIERTFQLFREVYQNSLAETSGLQVYCELRNGSVPARRAWSAVLAYLMADFKYLNE